MHAAISDYHDKQIVFGKKIPELKRNEVLADLLQQSATRFPQKTALIFTDQTLSYSELDHLARRYAHQLQKNGARPGQLLGLCLPRSLDLLVWQAALAYAGLGWLPFEFDTPAERLQTCLDDGQAYALITNAEKCKEFSFSTQVFDHRELEKTASFASDKMLQSDLLTCKSSDTAYVIYTSGSTGKPKGIQIAQGSICHFLRSENSVLGVSASDKVYQGFSVAFDMSFEEIWISYLVGATLWIAPKEVTNDPEALNLALRQQQITVLHAVPTLLALLDETVPDLRLVNLGGEMCPPSLVERWDRTGRQLFNTYGPTEATVSASLARLHANQAVTIGQPLPNYTLFVINADSDNSNRYLLNHGETGELCISGPGVASGYLGRPDLSTEKFLANPWASDEDELRFYRTGDLAQIEPDGTINCLGRVDDQVKIRGFRVELGEIEACICDHPLVVNAAVILKNWQDMPMLLAYLQVDAEVTDNAELTRQLRQQLRQKLPAYMIPAQFLFIDLMPRLTSGKIDRNNLKAREINAQQEPATSADIQRDLLSDSGRHVYDALVKLFPGQSLSLNSDFFADLGGHSLLMARLVSELRRRPELAAFKINDILQLREIGSLIEYADKLTGTPRASAKTTKPAAVAAPTWRRICCGLAQAFAIPWLVAFRMIQWLAPFFAYHFFTGEPGDSIPRAILLSVGVFLLLTLSEFAIAILGKWLIAGRLRAGRYPLWGFTYYRWWLADRLIEAAPSYMLAGSAMYRWWLRALGAKIGRDVIIGSLTLRAPDLLKIADNVSIGNAVNLENAYVEQGQLVLGQIDLAEHAYIGSYSVVQGDTELQAYAHLNGQSALMPGERVPAKQVWGGSPAVYQSEFNHAELPPRPQAGGWRQTIEAAYFITGSLLISALFFMPVFPSFIVIDWLDNSDWLSSSTSVNPVWQLCKYFILAFPAVALLILATALLSGAIRWLFLPKLKPGRYAVHSNTYLGKWLVNQIQDASMNVLHGVYATVFAPHWYRLLGAKIGKDAEISTALGVVPDMLTMGDETFVADAVMLGDEQIDGGWMDVQATTVAKRSFIGNGAYIPDGTHIPENVLIGVHTHAPANHAMHSGDTWLGSPALNLPAREQTSGYPEHLTYHPSWHRRLARGLIEAFRIISPHALVTAVGYTVVADLMPMAAEERWLEVVFYLALAGLLYGLACFLFVATLKWLLIGRYRKSNHPMWTSFVWLSEAITNMYEGIAIPNFMRYLRGTPLLPWAFRLLGTKIGKNVYMDSTDITEFDCVTIGDDCVINALACPQTHLFEDRVMKIDQVILGNHVNLGPRSSVLYSAELADQVQLGPLSLVMKGEYLPANTTWRGCPAALCSD